STAFDSGLDTVPGELAPKLALAACAEAEEDWDWADYYYRTVWRTDRTYVSAAFGLARALLATGANDEATDVLNSVPETSSHYITARLLAIQATTVAADPASLTPDELERAGRQLEALELDPVREARMSVDLLEAALAWTKSGRRELNAADRSVLGHRLTEYDLRRGLETSYRALARQASDEEERVALVDRANQVRPRTWLRPIRRAPTSRWPTPSRCGHGTCARTARPRWASVTGSARCAAATCCCTARRSVGPTRRCRWRPVSRATSPRSTPRASACAVAGRSRSAGI